MKLRCKGWERTIRAMWLDLLVVALVAAFGVIGWRSGALLMALRLIALVLAAVVAVKASDPLGPVVAGALGLSGLGGLATAFTVIFVAALVALRLAARLIARLLAPGDSIVGGFDRLLGATVGVATAGLFAWIGVSGLAIAGARFGSGVPALDLSSSVAARLAARHSFFQFIQIPDVEALQAVVTSARTLAMGDGSASPEDAERIAAYAALARHPKASFLEDPLIVRAILEGAWGTVLSDGRVWSFLADPDIASRLASLGTLPGAP